MNDNEAYQRDVLLVFEGEHDGDVAVEDPHELRQHVQVEREVDHRQHTRALLELVRVS